MFTNAQNPLAPPPMKPQRPYNTYITLSLQRERVVWHISLGTRGLTFDIAIIFDPIIISLICQIPEVENFNKSNPSSKDEKKKIYIYIYLYVCIPFILFFFFEFLKSACNFICFNFLYLPCPSRIPFLGFLYFQILIFVPDFPCK